MAMITVACVYRSGGVYTPEYVWNLEAAVRRNLHVPFAFRVITDEPQHFEHRGIAMPYPAWPRWWSKLNLFTPDVFDDGTLVLYFDLDTLIVGDISEFASYDGDLALLSDLFRGKPAQSGVMLFRAGSAPVRALWEAWIASPETHMRRFRGDGEFINAHVGAHDRLQTLWPGRIVSSKREGRSGPPSGASVVCMHGRPKPHETRDWRGDAWRGVGVA